VRELVRGVIGLADISFPSEISAYRIRPEAAAAVEEGMGRVRRQVKPIGPPDLRTWYNVSSSLFASASVKQVRRTRQCARVVALRYANRLVSTHTQRPTL
jgi:hypothetical protein